MVFNNALSFHRIKVILKKGSIGNIVPVATCWSVIFWYMQDKIGKDKWEIPCLRVKHDTL